MQNRSFHVNGMNRDEKAEDNGMEQSGYKLRWMNYASQNS